MTSWRSVSLARESAFASSFRHGPKEWMDLFQAPPPAHPAAWLLIDDVRGEKSHARNSCLHFQIRRYSSEGILEAAWAYLFSHSSVFLLENGTQEFPTCHCSPLASRSDMHAERDFFEFYRTQKISSFERSEESNVSIDKYDCFSSNFILLFEEENCFIQFSRFIKKIFA